MQTKQPSLTVETMQTMQCLICMNSYGMLHYLNLNLPALGLIHVIMEVVWWVQLLLSADKLLEHANCYQDLT